MSAAIVERLSTLANSEGGGPVADALEEASALIAELCTALETHPEYAANTTFAAIWSWLALKDGLLAKARGETVK